MCEVETFEFNNLEKLTLRTYSENDDWTNFILRNKKLKILKIYIGCKINYSKLLSELHELDKIIIRYVECKKNLQTAITLGNKWEIIENEVINRSFGQIYWRCIFKRIQKRIKTNN